MGLNENESFILLPVPSEKQVIMCCIVFLFDLPMNYEKRGMSSMGNRNGKCKYVDQMTAQPRKATQRVEVSRRILAWLFCELK